MADEAILEELVRGREFANQLRQVLAVNNIDQTKTSLFAQHLVNNVVDSFTNTLFHLNKHHSHMQLRREDMSSITPAKEDSQDSCKTTSSGGGRGSYKRRKTTETWEIVSESPTDLDGHEWRKYGQKTILNSKYSREYYRCTHKLDEKCQATKQVQRIQEKPVSYKTTYYDHHTCKNNMVLDYPSTTTTASSILLSFNNTFPIPTKQDCPFLSSNDSAVLDCTKQAMSSTLSSTTSSSSSTLESDGDHKDIMMMIYGLLYDSV